MRSDEVMGLVEKLDIACRDVGEEGGTVITRTTAKQHFKAKKALESAIRDLCAENERLKADYAELQDRFDHKFGNLCNECGKGFLDEDWAEERQKLEAELAEVKAELALHKQGVIHIRTPFLR